MDDTPNLALPLIAAAQDQKHVTHNDALLCLDALVQSAVLDRDLAAPPGAPAEGARYIVAASPTGAWSGKAGQIAARQDGGWRFYPARAGFLAYVVDEARLCVHDGAGWSPLAWSMQNLALLGLGTTADTANPFSAKVNKALWTARTAGEGGDGDLRLTLNKEATSDVVSLLFQTGFSGRAELGLVGEDRLAVKVSGDGSSWRTALTIDNATGGLDFLAGETSLASAAACDIGGAPSLRVAITGTTAITSFGPKANALRLLRFTGALTLTHNAGTLRLPGGANIAAAADDTCLAVSDASAAWRVLAYQRASGKPVSGPASTDIADSTATGRAALTAANAAALAAAAGVGPADAPTHAGLTVTGSNNFPVTIRSTDDSAANGPLIVLDRASATPAAGDVLAGFQFNGRDSAAATVNAGGMTVQLSNATAGSVATQYRFTAVTGGVLAQEFSAGGGLVVGSPTGGARGVGTVNGTALYDDNALLTCAAAAAEYRERGVVDTERWDAMAPDLILPDERVWIPEVEEVEIDVEVLERRPDRLVRRRRRRKVTRPKTRAVPVYDEDGLPVLDGGGRPVLAQEPVYREHVVPGRRVPRRNEAVHVFKAMVEGGFDPRDPEAYMARLRRDEAVPGLPTQAEWRHGRLSQGEWLGRLSIALEMLALSFGTLVERAGRPEARSG